MAQEEIQLVVKLTLFGIAVSPLLIDNLQTLRATNRNNVILCLAGFAMLGIEWSLGWNDRTPWYVAVQFLLGGALLLALPVIGGIPGGVAKTLIALLPWFAPVDFLLAATIGFVLMAFVGVVSRRNAPSALPFALAAVDVWTYGNAAFSIALVITVLLCGWMIWRRPAGVTSVGDA